MYAKFIPDRIVNDAVILLYRGHTKKSTLTIWIFEKCTENILKIISLYLCSEGLAIFWGFPYTNN